MSERHRRFTPLQKLLRRSANQQSWSAQLRAVLSTPLAHDCSVTDVRGDTAIVVCRTAASATRLRFMTDELLRELNQLADFRDVRHIRIRVAAS